MEQLLAFVMVALAVLPPSYRDQAEVGRDARMSTIGRAVVEVVMRARCAGAYAVPACKPIWFGGEKELAALLVTKGWCHAVS